MAPPPPSSTSQPRSRKKSQEVEKVVGRKDQQNNSSPLPSLPQRSASFHGKSTAAATAERLKIGRPKTQPEMLSSLKVVADDDDVLKLRGRIKVPNKVLVNVTVQGSLLGPLQVLACTDWTVHQLVDATVRLYVKEGRRPPLPAGEPSAFGLHYSQFSLEALDANEKLIGLGSRNFFLCPKVVNPSVVAAPVSSSSSSSSCSDEAGKASKIGIPWLRFIESLLF